MTKSGHGYYIQTWTVFQIRFFFSAKMKQGGILAVTRSDSAKTRTTLLLKAHIQMTPLLNGGGYVHLVILLIAKMLL